MLRRRAIRSLLVEEVAGVRTPRATSETKEEPEGGGDSPVAPDSAPPSPDTIDPASEELELQREALEKAERRSLLAVGVDWIALVVLFLLRDPSTPFLPVGPTVETVFTLGVIAVAVHSGFRLGQLEKIRAARRAFERLAD